MRASALLLLLRSTEALAAVPEAARQLALLVPRRVRVSASAAAGPILRAQQQKRALRSKISARASSAAAVERSSSRSARVNWHY